MNKYLIILILFVFQSCNGQGWQRSKKVIIIALDGLTNNALDSINTPHIDKLRRIGKTYVTVESEVEAWTAHGFSDAWTGVKSSKHLVIDNNSLNCCNDFATYPLLSDQIEAYDSNFKTYATSEFSSFFQTLVGTPDLEEHYPQNASKDGVNITNSVINRIRNHDDDFLIWRGANPDKAGHDYGFESQEYYDTLVHYDKLIGDIIWEVQNRPRCEEWLIVFHTDHGGIGTTHGRASYDARENEITVIYAGPAIKGSERGKVYQGGDLVDITATILDWLKIPNGNLDGVSRL